jgi:uncharacterized protein
MPDNASLLDAAIPRTISDAPTRVGNRRLAIIVWLRRVHGWIGLWGAVLGLLFGVSGVLLNHRAIMKLPGAQTQERNLQLRLPSPAPATATALADWVRDELKLGDRASRVREEPARPVPWGDRTLTQPARWSASLATPQRTYQVEYWVGNDFVSVRAGDSNFLATLNNLHKGVGLGVAWVLLADTIGGAMVLLSLTGVLLWTQLHRRRLIGLAIFTVSTLLTIGLAVGAL